MLLQQQQQNQQQYQQRQQSNVLACLIIKMFLLATLLMLLASVPSVRGIDNQNTNNSNNNKNNNNNNCINNNQLTPIINAEEHECDSLDLRNECDELLRLTGCTVIRGYLMILLLPKIDVFINVNASNNSTDHTDSDNMMKELNVNETCDYERYKFPLLREITDYLLFYDVKGLRSFRTLFPNLTVIRGRRLFLNYALSISTMPDLERVEFPSLLAIQNGHVYIGSSPKVCQLEKINWYALTLTTGQNHIFPMDSGDQFCPIENNTCGHCNSDNCWSTNVCQLIYKHNSSQYCDKECLGGCRANVEECLVCHNLTAHGKCVSNCPNGTYLVEHFQRCLTRDECIQLEYYTHDTNCIMNCPSGYRENTTMHECLKDDSFIKVCHSTEGNGTEPIIISSLYEADLYAQCHTINSSLLINIRNPINVEQLKQSLSTLRVVRGHVKISRSPYLKSLDFLSGLERIEGYPLESDLYALIVYDNTNLERFWRLSNATQKIDLGKGGLYVHRNDQLCNRVLHEFRQSLNHNRTRDSLQMNDNAVLCEPEQLDLRIRVLSHRVLLLSWPQTHTAEQVRILYRRLPHHNTNIQQKQDDENICTRINWERRLLFKNQLEKNGSDHIYRIEQLIPNTRYSVLVKTFETIVGNKYSNSNNTNSEDVLIERRSNVLNCTTESDWPTPVGLSVISKTNTSLMLQLTPRNRSFETISHYILRVYELPEAALEYRNYCNQQMHFYERESYKAHKEDYDDCCTRRIELREDIAFADSIHDDFGCSIDRSEYCDNSQSIPTTFPTFELHINGTEKTYNLTGLHVYRQYALEVLTCKNSSDNGTGCSSPAMHSERTNYTENADRLVDLRGCWSPSTHFYHVHFSEPQHPNGLLLTYTIHLLSEHLPNDAYEVHLQCITHAEHKANNYEFTIAQRDVNFVNVGVRVSSLATNDFNDYVPIGICDANGDSPVKIAGIGGGGGRHAHGLNIFLVCFLLGAGGTLLWVCYKRRYWRKCADLRVFLPRTPPRYHWRALTQLREAADMEDRLVLVDDFETVRFHNIPDDEHRYLE